MSALAKLMVLWGNSVSGSDVRYSKNMEELLEWGASVYLGEDEKIVEEADLVVYTAAVKKDDRELICAKKLNKKIISRDALLYEVSLEYDKVVAVSGTHGKTTVSSMIASVCLETTLSFTAHIGVEKGNLIYKGKEVFVTEACEYDRSFLSLKPDVGVVLNVEMDHPDTYKNLDEVYKSFNSFSSRINRGGILVLNADSEYYKVAKCTYKNMRTYAVESTADVVATNIINYGNGYYGFRIQENGFPNLDVKLSVQGYHNVYNALATFVTCIALGVERKTVVRGIEKFKGVSGRFELLGSVNGASVYRDYAHHPTEIRATVQTALKLKPSGRVITVFQPHTVSRTEALYNEFLTSFCDSDVVFVLKEYVARKEESGLTAFDLYEGLRDRGVNVVYYKNQFELSKGLFKTVQKGDVVLVLGAGDVSGIGELILK